MTRVRWGGKCWYRI